MDKTPGDIFPAQQRTIRETEEREHYGTEAKLLLSVHLHRHRLFVSIRCKFRSEQLKASNISLIWATGHSQGR